LLAVVFAACLDPNVTVLGPDPGSNSGPGPSSSPPPSQSNPPDNSQPPDTTGNPPDQTSTFDAGQPPPPGITCPPNGLEDGGSVVPVVEPPAISGGTMVVTPSGQLVVGDSDRDVVWIFDVTTSTAWSIGLQPGDEPGRTIVGPLGHVFVALRRAGQVAELDLVSGQVLARHDACAAPRGIAWSDADQTLYVACGEGVLMALKDVGASIISSQRFPVADDLRDVILVGDSLWVTTFRTAQVLSVTKQGQVSAIAGPIRGTSLTDPTVTFDPRVAWRAIPTPEGMLIAHQESRTTGVGTVFSCSPGEGTYGGSFDDLASDSMVHTQVTRVTAGPPGGEAFAAPVFQGVGTAVLPVDVAADEFHVAIAAAGDRSIFLITLYSAGSNTAQADQRIVMPGVPVAVAFLGNDLYAFIREPAQLVKVIDALNSAIPAPGAASIVSTGHELFHTGTPNHLACASCHPEAGEDGNVWALPEGNFRTPTLRGGISMTAPFHWGGEETTMSKLMFDIFGSRMGGPIESDDRVAALEHWLDAQPARTPPAQDPAAVQRGEALFNASDTGCTACHSGALGTNNTTVNVGTGQPLQVPRLVELSYRAPFLHDGRAPSLEDRFGPIGGGDTHGITSQLTAAQVSDLITYLKSR
jgi:cytochrome c553